MLSYLLATGHEGIEISALVRSEDHAYELRTMGVIPITFKGLDDLDLIKETASRHDGTFLIAIVDLLSRKFLTRS